MKEREPEKERISRGELYFLGHPGTKETFSGYGLTMRRNSKEFLAGLLMVDRPQPVDPAWMQQVDEIYGEAQLIPMTAGGERGILCQMTIEEESIPHLRAFAGELSVAIQQALELLLDEPPKPKLRLSWDEEVRAWRSEFIVPIEQPEPIREVPE